MAKPTRTKAEGRTTVELEPALRKQLEEHCQKEARTLTATITRAVLQYLEREEAKQR